MLWFSIIILIGSCLVLIRSSTWVVRSLTRIAKTLKWSEFLVSFCLMAFATSLPELFVGLSSAFHKIPQLSFGNVIGANILNLTLGIAVAVLVARGLKMRDQVARKDSFYTALIAFLPILLMLDGQVSRLDGIILLGVLILYFNRVLRQRRKFTGVFNNDITRDWIQFRSFLKDIGILFAGVALLLLSAEGVVRSASFLARQMNFSLVATGILFVSLGTALPEITFGIRALMMGHKEMVLGNFMGTVIVNSALILGVVSLISPLKIFNFSPYIVGILFTVIVALAFAIFARTGSKITRREAIILLGIYALFVVSQILAK